MKRYAFAPAHVSGIFAVHDAFAEPARSGSRGAGWCLQKGAYAGVAEAKETSIAINGVPAEAAVTAAALKHLAPKARFHVDIVLELPVGQGFGMSAAGTLAACLAASDLLGLEPEAALEAAHVAEVESGSGLGDAVGSWFGGAGLRIKPGIPPHGWAMHIHPPESEFLFCTLGGGIDTATIIRDPDWKEKSREHGDSAVDRILDAGREKVWKELLYESAAFSIVLGLRPEPMVALSRQLPKDTVAGQVMLGSTMWVYGVAGDLDRAEALLEGHGPVFRCKVDPNGARLVRGMPSPMA